MKKYIYLFLSLTFAIFLMISCGDRPEFVSPDSIDWQKRAQEIPAMDSLETGTSYLSVYSQIYNYTEHQLQDLTVTVSMRNTNRADTIYLNNVEYYSTSGKLIRKYIDRPVFLAPLETLEIIIEESDKQGGSGANFLFDWTVKEGTPEPFFEGVMISMTGAQGLSFVTEGRRVK